MIDQSGLDTKLARLLHRQGKLDLELLKSCLRESRARRPEAGNRTLARILVHRGILSEPEARECLERLATGSSSGEEMANSLARSGPQPVLETRKSSHDGETVAGRGWSDTGSGFAPWKAGDTVAGPRPGSSPGAGEVLTWRPGIRVGDYRLLDQLGAGGMGVVYSVEHVQTHQLLALKTLQEDPDPDLVERLKREGEALAQVGDHPNVVGVRGMGQAYGRVYLVMELVQGGDLPGRIRGGPLPFDEAARVARDLARGLSFLHAKGVLHRDLKPANVLFDAGGTPKLVDFGLAYVARADRLTRSGEILGTPNFMAPEQALLLRDRIGPWTDVYGLGGVLYYMLTGATPFEGPTLVEVMTKVVKDPAPSPKKRRGDVPAELDALCTAALAKDPGQRPTTEAFAAALDAFMERRAAGSASRLGALALLGLGVALAVGAGAFAALRARPPRGAAEAVAAVPTAAAPVPAPPPRRALAPIGWRCAPGDRGRLAIKTHSDWRNFVLAGARGRLDLGREIDLAYTVGDVTTRTARFSCTIERLVVRMKPVELDLTNAMEGMAELLQPLDFDSGRDQTGAFARAIGAPVAFTLDTTTGSVSSVDGTAAVQSRIYGDDVKGIAIHRHRLWELGDERGLARVLGSLVHVLPEESVTAGRVWEVRREIGVDDPQDRFRSLVTTALVESKELPGDAVEVSYSGTREGSPGRRVEGTARFGARGLERAACHDELFIPGLGDLYLDLELTFTPR